MPRKIKSKPSHAINSSVVIAKALSSDGFTDHIAGCVEKYWKQNSGLTDRQKRSIAKLREEITRMTSTMSVGDKLILGKFIGLHKKMSFDVGLRIGLTTFAHLNAKDLEEGE